ncbi:tRNA pseudouridine(55) synthase TruB [[Ruminococcus] lactaris]|uniref:tRNA pseudouridine(55) synthase TruB n=1 Tax=[Ruminococcus] lactaris TaxID=46228 RepID=UPI0023B08D8B|nr:tRNA pseudouridine(55) synthase TruB [[Ruminococcus] lactaris]MDE8698486.1 tRNA pseudouridine(55) synthase TruB [[Ruminococcus] lactaris]
MNGIINVYKEKGYTSHDVVAVLRKIAGQKKIGHTGTLDPDATGVLPVCLGRATKLCDLLTDRDKTYEAVLLLGKTTDTQDISGAILKEQPTDHLNEAEVTKVIESFKGTYDQIPPMYSALKVNGKKLYELAREGKTVERKSRKVTIYQIHIKKIQLPRVRMEVTCSKGTYIRTLCHDIGNRLGTGGCMEELTRTKVGRFELKDSLKLEELSDLAQNGRLEDALIPLDQMFSELQSVVPAEKYISKAYNGNDFFKNQLSEDGKFCSGEKVRVYDAQGHFIGVYRYMEDRKMFHLVKMFLDPEELR